MNVKRVEATSLPKCILFILLCVPVEFGKVHFYQFVFEPYEKFEN